jgi:DNA-binding LacI/PurR family transcriptional regulator
VARITDVARLAGVAPATVSIALSGKRPVATETRERVLAAARELNYQPNSIARNLRSRQSRTIALSIPFDSPLRTLSDGTQFRFIASIGDRLSEHGYSILCLVSKGDGLNTLVRLARGGEIDGVLLMEVQRVDPRVEGLRDEKFPFVSIGRPSNANGVIRVDYDQEHAADLAVSHLLDLGHRHIAFLGSHHTFGYQHYCMLGFQRALRKYHLPVLPFQMLDYRDPALLSAALQPLLDPGTPLTALVLANDIDAMTALHVFADAGRCIPDDISIVIIGSTPMTALAQPPLTATSLPAEDMSRTAVDLLVDLLNGTRPKRLEHIIPIELLVRSSTRRIGPPVISTSPPDPDTRAGVDEGRHALETIGLLVGHRS